MAAKNVAVGCSWRLSPTGSAVALGAAVDARPVADARPVVVDATPAIVPVVVDAAPAIVPVVVDATPARDAATVLTPVQRRQRQRRRIDGARRHVGREQQDQAQPGGGGERL